MKDTALLVVSFGTSYQETREKTNWKQLKRYGCRISKLI